MKLLLIDADPVAREQLQHAAHAGLDCETVGVDDFVLGWTTLMEAERPFDAVLADPGRVTGTGFEWLRQIQTGSWARPVSLVLCFAPDATTMDRALAAGARHFVFKPYSPSAIVTKLRQIAQARAHFNFETAGLRG